MTPPEGGAVAFDVLLTAGAERDIESIHDFIIEYDGPSAANRVLDELSHVLENLSAFPERGSCPGELAELGIKVYRQVFFKPYRIIYRVIDRRVIIYLIVDGRRDMQAVLSRRLLGA